MSRFVVLAATMFALSASTVNAATIWDESVKGDLSNNYLAPTPLVFGPGSNDVIGTAGRLPSTGLIDYDMFTFAMPAGFTLGAIVVASTNTPSLSFIGLSSSAVLGADPDVINGGSAAGLIGWMHYSQGSINTNILPLMNTTSFAASGFSLPLAPGPYTVLLQDTGTTPVSYDFSPARSHSAAAGSGAGDLRDADGGVSGCSA